MPAPAITVIAAIALVALTAAIAVALVLLSTRRAAREVAAAEARIVEAREQQDRIDHSRRELMAWISHDLRTPLAGISAMSEALEDGMAADPQRFHRRLVELSTQMSGMVDDLFELSKIDTGVLRLRLEPVALVDVVQDAVRALREVAPDRVVTVRAPEAPVMVMADARELSRAVSNLLVNAVQHTPAGASISVTADVVDGRPSVTVVDSGSGIDDTDLDRVFEAGWRGTSETNAIGGALTGGAGLGLAIVRGIAQAHRGEVSVRNIPGGCRFDIQLPVDSAVVVA